MAKTKTFQHLHMYIHRIALSVILPPRQPQPEGEAELSPPLQAIITGTKAGKPPRRLRAAEEASVAARGSPKASPKLTAAVLSKYVENPNTSSPVASRSRSSSLRLTSSVPSPDSALSKSTKSIKSVKFPLLKQLTVGDIDMRKNILAKADSSELESETDGGVADKHPQEWRGLKIDVLQSRIQRLVVLMELSEPGTIPDARILASLIDLVSCATYCLRILRNNS